MPKAPCSPPPNSQSKLGPPPAPIKKKYTTKTILISSEYKKYYWNDVDDIILKKHYFHDQDGLLHGKCSYYYEDGESLMSKSTYENGDRIDLEEYNKDGTIKKPTHLNSNSSSPGFSDYDEDINFSPGTFYYSFNRDDEESEDENAPFSQPSSPKY